METSWEDRKPLITQKTVHNVYGLFSAISMASYPVVEPTDILSLTMFGSSF